MGLEGNAEMEREYDMIASLGGSCDAAAQLRLRNLRPFAYHLDWCLMLDECAVDYLPNGFQTHFAEFFKKENLVEWTPVAGADVANMAPNRYMDKQTGWIFIHHFLQPLSAPGYYEQIAGIMRRRTERFFERLDAATSALFLLSVNRPFFQISAVDALYGQLCRQYPGKRIDIRAIQFGADADWADPDRWGGGAFRYARRHNAYDWGGGTRTATNFEWSFLDNVRLSGFPPALKWNERLAWKVWKHLGKSLARSGRLPMTGLDVGVGGKF